MLVYLKSADVEIHPSYRADSSQKIVLEFTNRAQFSPRILPLLVTQTLVVENRTDSALNVNLMLPGEAGRSPSLSSDPQTTYNFTRRQNIPIPVVCNIRPWPKAFILPRDNPYFAVTGEDGTFEIKNLPVGEWEFRTWHERWGFLDSPASPQGRFKFVIRPGDNELATVRLKLQ